MDKIYKLTVVIKKFCFFIVLIPIFIISVENEHQDESISNIGHVGYIKASDIDFLSNIFNLKNSYKIPVVLKVKKLYYTYFTSKSYKQIDNVKNNYPLIKEYIKIS